MVSYLGKILIDRIGADQFKALVPLYYVSKFRVSERTAPSAASITAHRG